MVTLFLTEKDIPTLTALSGNIDADKLKQHIYNAQISNLRRVLGVPLYDKMLEDYKNDDLTGDYLVIYTDYLVDILVFFSAVNFLSFDPVFDDMADEKLSRKISRYRQLSVNAEGNFKEYLKTITIPEVTEEDKLKDSTNVINWN
jgi:hypothetical protein